MQAIKNLIDTAMVYEEEDFQPLQYGYHLNPDVSEHRMFNMLRDVEENLERKLRVKSNNEVQAILARIKFTKTFLQILISFNKDQMHNMNPDRQKLLTLCLETLSTVQETIPLGIENVDNDSELSLGLVPSINQRLLPPTFPRYTKIKTRSEAVQYFMKVIEHFKVVSKIQSISPLHQALDFFIDFSQMNPCILSRSVLQLLYIGTNDSAVKDSLKEAIKSFICPPAMFSNTLLKNDEAKHHIDTFLTRCAGPFRNFLQLCGHNRARQRDKLIYSLEEFAELQYDAERLDSYLHNILTGNFLLPVSHMACFGTWVLYYTLRIMIMYVLSGFELELYSVHEFYYIYWYLYEHLYGWLISALSRAETFLTENENLVDSQKNKGASKNRAKNIKKSRPYKRDISYLKALQIICGGYYKALVGLRLEGKLTMPNPLFDNEQVRYQHRFAPFQNILTPPPVQYSEFREMTTFEMDQQQSLNSIFLYIDGCNHFHQARQLLESIPTNPEVVDLITVCKTNFVVLKLLAGGHKKDSKKPPDFDFSKSKYYPIIKLN